MNSELFERLCREVKFDPDTNEAEMLSAAVSCALNRIDALDAVAVGELPSDREAVSACALREDDPECAGNDAIKKKTFYNVPGIMK